MIRFILRCLVTFGFAVSVSPMEVGMSELVADYFAFKRIHTVSVITCKTSDVWMFTKKLSSGMSWRVLELEYEAATNDSTLWLEKALRSEHQQQGVFLDYDCETGRNILQNISLYNESYNWLVWSRSYSPEKVMTPVRLSLDTEMTWATPNNNSVTLTDVYKISTTLSYVVTTSAGTWNLDTHQLDYHLTSFKYIRRGNLNRLSFNAAVVLSSGATNDLEERLSSNEDRHVDSSTKHNFALYKELQQMFNFTLRLHAAKSEGDAHSSGEFDGLMGMLQRDEMDLGISSVIPWPNRLQVVDLVVPTWEFRAAVMFRHPLLSDPYMLLKPFTKTVWLCVLFSWVLVLITAGLINLLEMKLMYQQKKDSLSTTILVILSAISEQGSEVDSKWLSWRVVYLVTLVQVVLLNSYYGACMVSNLLQPPARTINTVQDVIDSDLQVGYVANRINQDLFENPLDPAVKELYNKKLKMHPVYSLRSALDKLRFENFAVHEEMVALYPDIEREFNNDEKCSLAEVQLFPSVMTYTVVRKGSPYREMFRYGFLKLKERGILKHELIYWRPPVPRCQYLDKTRSIDMKDIFPAFSIFTAGVALAITLFLCERLQFLWFISFLTNMRHWRKKRN